MKEAVDGIVESPVPVNRWNGLPLSKKYHDLLSKRKTLPVWSKKAEFLALLNDNQVVIFAGEPGAGKSTQVPQFVLEAMDLQNQMVCCTQPNRVAVFCASIRAAQELDVSLGEEVGFHICFEDRSSSKTVLKYLTDEMLVTEAKIDPLLESYKVVILDEVHEGTLATDVLFGLLKILLRQRPDLKLVIMSVSCEAEKFRNFFCGAPLIQAPDTTHPVEFFYTQHPVEDYLYVAIETVVNTLTNEPPGDILVFLPGRKEIELACRDISLRVANLGDQVGPVTVIPLYLTITPATMQNMFEPAQGAPSGRKVIVSSSIAETSLFIEGVAYVIDSGLVQQKVYKPLLGVESLVLSRISKACAFKRLKCAGGSQSGKCFRLYTKSFYDDLDPETQPEILQSNLTTTVLTLKNIGIDQIANFEFMNHPDVESLKYDLGILHHLRVLDDDANFTELGQRISEFPLDPKIGRMLVVSPDFECSYELLTIAAMLSVPSCFINPLGAREVHIFSQVRDPKGDHFTLLNVYNLFKRKNEDEKWCVENGLDYFALKSAANLRIHLARIFFRLKLGLYSTPLVSCDHHKNISKALLSGGFLQLAHLNHDGVYRLTLEDSQELGMYCSSSLDGNPKWVIYHTCFSDKNQMLTVTEICDDWIVEVIPLCFNIETFPVGKIKAALERRFQNMKKEEHGKGVCEAD